MTDTTTITKTTYLQQDPLGNVIGGITTGGAVDGASVIAEPWGFHDVGTLGTATSDTNRLRLKGMFYEGDSTQLFFVRARWYDPRTHRFMTQDPIGVFGGINPYVFVTNDPVNNSDPSGLRTGDRGPCSLLAACGNPWWEDAPLWQGGGFSGTPCSKIVTQSDWLRCLEELKRILREGGPAPVSSRGRIVYVGGTGSLVFGTGPTASAGGWRGAGTFGYFITLGWGFGVDVGGGGMGGVAGSMAAFKGPSVFECAGGGAGVNFAPCGARNDAGYSGSGSIMGGPIPITSAAGVWSTIVFDIGNSWVARWYREALTAWYGRLGIRYW